MLIDLASSAELFHTATGTAFADLTLDGQRETWPVRSSRFRTWLRRRYYTATGEAPSGAAVNSALDHIEAQAQFDTPSAPSTSVLRVKRSSCAAATMRPSITSAAVLS